jgi:hypothetical protein
MFLDLRFHKKDPNESFSEAVHIMVQLFRYHKANMSLWNKISTQDSIPDGCKNFLSTIASTPILETTQSPIQLPPAAPLPRRKTTETYS